MSAPVTYNVGNTPCDCTDPAASYTFGGTVFIDDHENRGCFRHEVHGTRKGRGVVLALRPCDLAELLSDARHYSENSGSYGPDLFGLCASARGVVKRIRSQSSQPPNQK